MTSTRSLSLVIGLLVLGTSSVAGAQGRDLGSPYPPRDATPATTGPAATVQTPIVSSTPDSYEDASVPAPPSATPVYAAPRGAMVADSPDVHIGTTTATRLRALDADLQILAARGGGSVLDGILMLLMAGATAGWGAFLQTNGTPPGVEPYQAYYLYVSAGAAVTRAILSFALMTNPSAIAIRYSHMPMASASDVRARLRYGESQLDSLADQARLLRILDGSINLAAGLAVLPFVFATGSFDTSNFSNWGLLLLGGLGAVFGVVALLSSTEAERRQGAYHDLRDRILATPQGMDDEDMLEREAAASAASAVDVTPVLSFGPTGGFAGASVTF